MFKKFAKIEGDMMRTSITKSTDGLQLTREEIENVINFLHSKISAIEINGNVKSSRFDES